MNKLIVTFIVVSLATAALSLPSKITKSNKCKLYRTGAFDKNKVVVVELENEDIKAVCKFRGKVSFGKFRLVAVPQIDNLAGKELRVSYNVAFHDKDANLICCVCQVSKVKPDAAALQLASSVNNIPESEFNKIASYQLVIYVNDSNDE